ncbi:DUF4974 domain-containing protein [Pedobacter sp. MC2016-14]|uniref:FecR family protein n=1 Tax=Pedobacter sp. MC2016-14 TaxID=2897327 RepID=UPI001E29E6D8|nr:FecR family protein [Pedobacter sp. MC2016-14]MCD0488624.1 DUF4974 domain-containing protein [Pedobacter sp. MC2016-14]
MTDPEALIAKYKAGTCTAQELVLIDKWLLKIDAGNKSDLNDEDFDQARQEVWTRIQSMQGIKTGLMVNPETGMKTLWPRLAIAATVLFVLSFGLYFYQKYNDQGAKFEKHDIAAGKQGATLTLANGKKISLGEAKNGALANEQGVSITKTASGQLLYILGNSTKAGNHASNTLATAKGQTYQVQLPDGSRVWLNAASELKYPVSFAGAKQRRISLSGEAYFEISKDRTHPFVVKTSQQEVEVLGTHFNIDGYADEAMIKTTLLEGAVRVSSGIGDEGVVLKPGDQATLFRGKIGVEKVNTEQAVAWQNGYFMFEHEDIRSVMRKIARWYNVEIVFDGPLPEDTFGGTVNRFASVSQVLKKLEFTGKVQFKIEGRRITVTK